MKEDASTVGDVDHYVIIRINYILAYATYSLESNVIS
jgi:hypothetical protein